MLVELPEKYLSTLEGLRKAKLLDLEAMKDAQKKEQDQVCMK